MGYELDAGLCKADWIKLHGDWKAVAIIEYMDRHMAGRGPAMTQPTRETRLAALAREATPGPWRVEGAGGHDVIITADDPDWVANIGNWGRQHPDLNSNQFHQVFEADTADATYIAAADPQVIAAMAAVVGAARAYHHWCDAPDSDFLDALAAWDALEEAK